MRAKHRHELKTNELAEWINNLPQWAKENLRMIIGVSAVIVVVAVFYLWRGYQKNVISVQKQLELTKLITLLPQGKSQILRAQVGGFDTSYMLIQTADNLRAAAQSTNNDQMAALALIKRAEALRTELHYRFGTVSTQDLTTQINMAKASYTEALEKCSSNSSLTATAEFGLGLCEEEIGNFEKAQQTYRDIAANPRLEGTVAAAAAKQRLETIADYQQKILFKAAPPAPVGAQVKPTPAAPIQPKIELKPLDINQPSR